jgi:hypothetical protein
MELNSRSDESSEFGRTNALIRAAEVRQTARAVAVDKTRVQTTNSAQMANDPTLRETNLLARIETSHCNSDTCEKVYDISIARIDLNRNQLMHGRSAD